MKKPRILLMVLVVFVVLVAACGDDTSETAASEASPTTMAAGMDAMDADEMEDMDADEMEDMTEGDHDHDHSGESAAAEWDGGAPPTVEASVEGNAESGWDLIATVSGFKFSEPTDEVHVPGWGHTHVFLDGELVSMSYEPVVHLDELAPGPHQFRVTLARNDHVDYAIDGEVIGASHDFVVEGVADAADLIVALTFAGGDVSGDTGRLAAALGDIVEITVESDVSEEIHVHGYDLFAAVSPDSPALIRFTADVPGVFEVELEESGTLLFELEVS